MSTHRCEDDLVNILRQPPRIAARCKQTELGVGGGPITHAPVQTLARFVLLHPDEAGGLVFKAPSLDDLLRARILWRPYAAIRQPYAPKEQRPYAPKEQRTVVGGEIAHRQRLDVVERRGVVVALSAALLALAAPGAACSSFRPDS